VPSPIQRGLPRAVDIAASIVALTLATPVLLIVAIAIRLTSGGPVLFRHPRVGYQGRRFEMLKFRTMDRGLPGASVTSKRDPRITTIGRVLRKTKLDELPQLWNVVRGEMALVGPRPESIQYADPSDPIWRDVLLARPGVTDPVTLQLRNEEELLAAAGTDYERFYREHLLPYKLRGYREYLARRTCRTDVTVLMRTVACIVLPHRSPPPLPGQIASLGHDLGGTRP
jgi:lipopolysaccharide/colanic/teichoic acid biosynthesis glycosyltransferase